MATREEWIEKSLKDAPVSGKLILQRALEGLASPRQAIKAKCLECTGFERKSISNCLSLSCPLWLYRPYQVKDRKKSKVKSK